MVTLEAILERNNLNRAYKQVKANKGGAGVWTYCGTTFVRTPSR